MPSKWLIEELAVTSGRINTLLDAYRINEAVEATYQFIWGSFCDWGLECAKESFTGSDKEKKDDAISMLVFVLEGILRLISPVMPFVAEELWHKIPAHPDWDRPASLVIASFPDVTKLPRHEAAALEWRSVQELITGLRSVRAQAGIPPKDPIVAHVRADKTLAVIFKTSEAMIKRLVNVSEFASSDTQKRPGQSLVAVGKGFEAYVPAEGLLDVDKEKKRLSSEIARISKIVSGINAKLTNENFVARAPEDILATTRAQRDNLTAQMESLTLGLGALD